MCYLPTPAVGRAFSRVCLFVRALTAKRRELSTPNLVHVYSLAVARHALTHRSKGQRSRSHSYENRQGRTVASDACCYRRCERRYACRFDCLCFLVIVFMIGSKSLSWKYCRLWGKRTAFTRSAITPPKVNRFGWNLEQCEPNVGDWLWHILGAIRAVATEGRLLHFALLLKVLHRRHCLVAEAYINSL